MPGRRNPRRKMVMTVYKKNIIPRRPLQYAVPHWHVRKGIARAGMHPMWNFLPVTQRIAGRLCPIKNFFGSHHCVKRNVKYFKGKYFQESFSVVSTRIL
jgi:hypothetical protein